MWQLFERERVAEQDTQSTGVPSFRVLVGSHIHSFRIRVNCSNGEDAQQASLIYNPQQTYVGRIPVHAGGPETRIGLVINNGAQRWLIVFPGNLEHGHVEVLHALLARISRKNPRLELAKGTELQLQDRSRWPDNLSKPHCHCLKKEENTLNSYTCHSFLRTEKMHTAQL